MPVRLTESRLPENITPESLGFSVADGPISLISYLPGRIGIGPNKNYFQNKYVVFITEDPVGINGNQYNSEDIFYRWRLSVLNNNIEVFSYEPPAPLEVGIFEITINEDPIDENTHLFNLSDNGATGISVILEINARINQNFVSLRTLTLDHQIINENPFIETLVGLNASSAIQGDPFITRLIGNDLQPYINEATTGLDASDLGLAANFSTAISYLNLIKNRFLLSAENIALEEALNESTTEVSLGLFQAQGIGYIKPFLFNMFYPNEAIVNIENNNFAIYERIETYLNSNGNNKIDLFNLIRFPKTAMKLCTFILARLKARNPNWASLVLLNEECLKSITTEFIDGPQNEIEKFNDVANRVYQIAWSPYIQALLQAPRDQNNQLFLYELIRIQILDIRSGNPIQNGRVKKVQIRYSDANGNGSFEKNYPITRDAIVGNGLVERVQRVFRHKYQNLNPSINWHPGVTFGTWDEETRIEFNLFWENRLPGGQITHNSNTSPPSEYLLRYIIEEHSSLRITDPDGYILVRIPKDLFGNRRVSINIGFHEFPIALEKLSNQNNGITRPFGSTETNFRISWIGGLNGEHQSTNWDNTIAGTAHFGWEIREDSHNFSRLKVAIPLILKNDLSAFQEFDNSLFSEFYQAGSELPHFVLFGLQWCQPIWQPIPQYVSHWIQGKVNPRNGKSEGVTQLIPTNANRNLPVLVSRHIGGGSGKGRDYGMHVSFRNNTRNELNQVINNTQNNNLHNAGINPIVFVQSYPNNIAPRGQGEQHDGTDYYAIEGESPVFAPHGGRVCTLWGTQTAKSDSNGYGIQRIILFDNFYFRLAHLDGELNRSITSPDLTLTDTNSNNGYVMAGLKLAFAGRTFRENANTDQNRYYQSGATHLHLEVCITNSNNPRCSSNPTRRLGNALSVFNLYPDHAINRIVFLNNDSNRLFPCDCHWPNNSPHSARVCAIRTQTNSNTVISSRCWASRNLYCPYLRPNNFDNLPNNTKNLLNTFRIQSQLTYLYEDDSNQAEPPSNRYIDPNGIDGNWGGSAENAIRRFRNKHWAEINPGIPKPAENLISDAIPTEGDATWNILNQRAPYPRTNLARVDK